MELIITAALALLTQVAPSLAGAGAVGTAIQLVSAILPPVIQLAPAGINVVKGVIATLRGNKSTTAQQMDELDALDAQCDAILDAAITKAEAEDAAAAGT